jgi:hypothetical protein
MAQTNRSVRAATSSNLFLISGMVAVPSRYEADARIAAALEAVLAGDEDQADEDDDDQGDDDDGPAETAVPEG